MPDIGTFVPSLLSYFLIVWFVAYLFVCWIGKRMAGPLHALHAAMMLGGGFGLIVLVGLPIFLAFIAHADPLGWLWAYIAHVLSQP